MSKSVTYTSNGGCEWQVPSPPVRTRAGGHAACERRVEKPRENRQRFFAAKLKFAQYDRAPLIVGGVTRARTYDIHVFFGFTLRILSRLGGFQRIQPAGEKTRERGPRSEPRRAINGFFRFVFDGNGPSRRNRRQQIRTTAGYTYSDTRRLSVSVFFFSHPPRVFSNFRARKIRGDRFSQAIATAGTRRRRTGTRSRSDVGELRTRKKK